MSELTELEQSADREARHGHRELVERLEARVAELEAQNRWLLNDAETVQHALDAEWNAAIRAAVDLAIRHTFGHTDDRVASKIKTLLRNEGGSDD